MNQSLLGKLVGEEILKSQEIIFKKKMNIIFTRPLIDTEDLMTNFFSSGHKIIHLPTLSISSTT